MSVSVADAVKARRTHKVLGNTTNPVVGSAQDTQMLDAMIEAAGNAPVHYACDRVHLGKLSSPVPWRAYKLGKQTCNGLMEHLLENGDTTKVPNMLAAAEFLIQVTWLPDAGTIINCDAGKEEPAFDGTLRNMEHIAAASSFIQSLLLIADNSGFRTYWSSGGKLRSAEVFDFLGMPETELLLGAIFLFPRDVGVAEVKPGSMAEKRGNLTDWSVWVGEQDTR